MHCACGIKSFGTESSPGPCRAGTGGGRYGKNADTYDHGFCQLAGQKILICDIVNAMQEHARGVCSFLVRVAWAALYDAQAAAHAVLNAAGLLADLPLHATTGIWTQ